MVITIEKTRALLDALKTAGLNSQEIARALELHQVKSNARSVRHWHSGKTTVRNVEYRALRDLVEEVNRK